MLNKEITNILEEIYVKKNFELYLTRCNESFRLDDETINILEKYNFICKEIKNQLSPSVMFPINFGKFVKYSFNVKYKGELIFSKLAKAYSLNFFYEINNPDPEGYSPDFYDGSDEPLTRKKADFFDEFPLSLKKSGFARVIKKEKDLILTEIKYQSPNEIYNGKVDLWTALTYDVLDKLES